MTSLSSPPPDSSQSLSLSITHKQREGGKEGWREGGVEGGKRSTFLILLTTTKLTFKVIFQDCKRKYL